MPLMCEKGGICSQALDMVMDSDLVFWAGRYDLYVVWSTDRRHPWDLLTSSETVAAVLEIGVQGSSGKVLRFLFFLFAFLLPTFYPPAETL